MPPDRAYLVCATPRSGSTLLCELLRATGVAGAPLEHFETLRHSGLPRQPREYFDGLRDPAVVDRLPPLQPPQPAPEDPERWWGRVLEQGSTDNGVWAGKIMWGHTEDFVARAHPLTGENTLQGALVALLGEVRLVFVTRADTVAQAVSLWRAVQTEEWRDGSGTPGEAEYSFGGIDHLVCQLRDHDEAWRHWFAEEGWSPHVIAYEELNADPRAVAEGALEFLGLPGDVPDPPTSRQGDDRSARWIERYRSEAGVSA